MINPKNASSLMSDLSLMVKQSTSEVKKCDYTSEVFYPTFTTCYLSGFFVILDKSPPYLEDF